MDFKEIIKADKIINDIVLYTGVSREDILAVLLTYQDITKEEN